MKEKSLRNWRSCRLLLPLMSLLLPRSGAAIDLIKPHGELHGSVGWPGYDWSEDYERVLPGGITVGADLGFKLSATFADVKFKGDCRLSYDNWPGPGTLLFTNTSGSATMALGFKAWAKGKLEHPGLRFYAGWPIGWIRLIPKIRVTRSLVDRDYMLEDEESCTNYLLGTSVTLSDEGKDIEICSKDISLKPIFSTNDLVAVVGISVTPGLASTIRGLALGSSAATFTNALPQAVSLSNDTFVVSDIVLTSSNTISLTLRPNVVIGYKVPGIAADEFSFPIVTVPISVSSSTFTTTPRSVTFNNPNDAQAVTLAASETVCAGTNASATLNGTVNPGGVISTAWFEWGTTTNYGQTVALTDTGDGTNDMSLTYELTGLEPGVTYHYRAMVTNGIGWKAGEDRTFGPLFLALAGDDPLILLPGTPFTDPGFSLAGLTPAQAISAGHAHSLALLTSGNVAAWGDNRYGQCTVPTGLTNVAAIAAGGNHSLALKPDGSVVGWGAGAPRAFHALSFDGSDDYVDVPDGTYFSGDLTIEAWVFPRQFTTWARVLDFGNGPGADNVLLAFSQNTTGRPEFNVRWGSELKGSVTSPQALVLNQWSHLAVTLHGTTAMLYINGIPQATNTIPPPQNVVRTNNYVARSNWSEPPANAIMDEVRMWNVARSPADIQADMMHPLSGTESNLVAYWKFDEAGGTTATNSASTGSAYNGTLVNSPTWVPRWSEFGEPVIPAGATNVSAIAAGYNHSLALKTNGTLIGWGDNSSGQTNVPAGLTNVVAIAAGAAHSLALQNDGTVVGWGAGDPGASGSALSLDGTNDYVSVNAGPVLSNRSFTVEFWARRGNADTNHQWMVGQGTSAANQGLHIGFADNKMYFNFWGNDSSTTNTFTDSLWHHWAFTYNSTSRDRKIFCDGTLVGQDTATTNYVGSGPMYLGATLNATIPFHGRLDEVRVWNVARSPADIQADMLHPLTGGEPGLVAYWNFDEGSGSTATNSACTGSALNGTLYGTTRVPGWSDFGQTASATNVMAITAGAWHSLAVQSNGTVVAWGLNNQGQCDPPPGLTSVVAIAAGAAHSLALKQDGTVVGWGDTSFGRTNTPTAATNVVTIAAGDFHSLALRSDGTVVAWGGSDSGQTEVPLRLSGTTIGVTGIVDTNVPGAYTLTYWLTNAPGVVSSVTRTVVVAGPPVANTLAASDLLTVGTNASVTLNGTVNPWVSPTTAWFEWGTGTNYDHASALTDIGSGWGIVDSSTVLTNLMAGVTYQFRMVASNAVGISYGPPRTFYPPYLNLYGTNPLVCPVGSIFVDPGFAVMPQQTNRAVAIAAGGFHSLALKPERNVVGWGNNLAGQISIPASATDAVAIEAGGFHSLALMPDGMVVGWGDNSSGQTNVPAGATNVSAIAAGYNHSLALKQDGTIIGWGDNSSGQTNVPVGLTNVTAIAAGAAHSLALQTDGTVVGWGAGALGSFGHALSFDGTNDYVSVPPSSALDLTNGTIEFWVSRGAVVGNACILANRYWPQNSTTRYSVHLNGANIGLYNGDTYLEVPFPTAVGRWHHVALVCSGGNTEVFGDGVSCGFTGNAFNTLVTGQQLTIGITYGGTNTLKEPFAGTLDEVRIWNVARSQAEIQADMVHPLTGTEPGLVAYWQFDEGSGATATNSASTGSAYSGALVNDPAWVPGWSDFGQTTIAASATNVMAIAAGAWHSLALRSDGSVVAWGLNDCGQCDAPVGLADVVAIAAGGAHSLALKQDGTVAGWGDNDHGQTNGLLAGSYVMAIAAGGFHSLALKADGSVVSWGDNRFEQTNVPAGLSDYAGNALRISTVDANAVGSYTITYWVTNELGVVATATRTVAVAAPPEVFTWGGTGVFSDGTNASATLTGTVNPNAIPTTAWFEWGTNLSYGHSSPAMDVGDGWDPKPIIAAVTDLTAGISNHFRVSASNALGVVYGEDQSIFPLLLTLNEGAPSILPCPADAADPCASVIDPTLIPIRAIAAGSSFSMGLRNDGTICGWGYGADEAGQITNVPVGLSNVSAIAAGGDGLGVALKNDGSVVAWGRRDYGLTNVPSDLGNVVAVAAGAYHCLALRSNTTVVAWGSNSHGETNVPPGLSNVIAIAASGANRGGIPYGHSLALKSDGTVVAWGDNTYNETNVPPGLSDVVAIAAGRAQSLALQGDGTVVGWGGSTTIPSGLSNSIAIAAGDGFGLALRTNGSVVGWGYNAYGQTAVPPSATNGVMAIAAGARHSLALRADGSVVAWGWNGYGQTEVPTCYGIPAVTMTVAPDTNAPGYYTLTYWATNTIDTNSMDAVGTATRTVQVLNTDPPVVTLNGPNPMTTGLGYTFTDPGATAVEPCSGSSLPVTVTGSVDTNAAGSYTLTYQAANVLGAIGTTNRIVNVVPDTTPPVLTCPDVVATAPPGECEFAVTFSATATDDWDPAPVVACVPPSGSMFPVGRTTVVATARDAAGNTSTNAFTVSVYPSSQLGPAGETWTARETNRSWRCVASSADGSKLVAGAYDDQIYTSADFGATWIPRLAGSWGSVASSADGTKLVAAESGGSARLLTSVDSGQTWVTRLSGRSHESVASSADGIKLVGVVWDGQIYTSTDGGTNWNARMTDANRAWKCVASSVDGTKLVAVAYYSDRIYASTDSGTNWTVTSAPSGGWYSVASSADGSKLVAVVRFGQIYTSTDGGTNWTAREINRNWESVASSADGLRLVAAVSGGQIYTSTDGGTNWTAQESNRNWYSVASSADGTRLVAVVSGGQIYTSVGALPLTNPPMILGAANQVIEATGPSGAVATFSVTATNVCQPFVPVTCTPPSGSTFPLGTNVVSCEAVDAFGVTNTATFTVTVILPAQPLFAGYTVPAPGKFRLQGTGTAGLTYTLQTSTNLVDWVNHTNLLADPGGLIECLMDMETNAPACFYRLQWP